MICFESKLDDEVEFITGTLCNNGFPKDIVRSVIRDKISDFSKIKPDSVQRYTISGCFRLVILVIDLPTGSLLVHVSAIFLSTCMWFSVRGLF